MNRSMRRRPCLVVFLLILGLATGIAWAAPETPRAPGKPLDIGDQRQLLFDNRFLVESQGVQLFVHPPRKTGEMNIKPERPWEVGGVGPYSSVLWDGQNYHMWYHVMTTVQWHTGKENGCICYARSNDGIHWERPDLGLIEFEGSRKNNIVFGQGAAGVKLGQDGGMVFIDPNAPPEEKLRLLIRMEAEGEGLHLYSSPDGIHWKLTHPSVVTARPQARGHHLDSQNVMFWDDRIGKYVVYGRKNLLRDGSAGRAIFRAESERLGGFPVVQDAATVFGPDTMDLAHGSTGVVDYYMSAAIKYPWAQDAYFMFPTAYYHYIGGVLPEFTDEVPTNAGPLDTRFAASRDGIRWQRFNRRAFVGLGMKGEFDWASARTIWGVLPDVAGREMYMYYRASDWLHGWDRDERNKKLLTEAGLHASQNIAVLSRLVLRRDGFVSVRAAYTGGEFVTPRVTFKGNKLQINIDTSAAGIAQVEFIDENGLPIDGFGANQCDLIHTCNEINRVVSWKGNSDVSSLAGKPIQIRFVLRDCDLYAFQFTQ